MRPPPRAGSLRTGILAATAGAAVAVAALAPRIAQDPQYHRFVDGRTLLRVPNALNVLSSAGFALVGAWGLLALRGSAVLADPRERLPWAVLFLGAALTAAGSAWYHLDPTNATLAWDRLPMTLGFMGLLAALLAERVSLEAGLRALAPLVVAGAASVAYWAFTEARGAGDLRPYVLVQLYPLVAVPLLLELFPARYTRGADLVVALAWYAAAKVAESYDAEVYAALRLVSGHTLKHVFAALAVGWLVRMLLLRRPVAVRATEAPRAA
jgi:hypothetical protein